MRDMDPREVFAKARAYDDLRYKADRQAEEITNLRAIIQIQQRRIIELKKKSPDMGAKS